VNQTLTSINLSRNGIGNGIEDEGAKYIADALKVNQTLTEIDLYGNKIGDGDVKHLAEALEVNKTLTFMNLASNNIGDNGVIHILNMLQKHKTPLHVDLIENRNSSQMKDRLRDIHTINKYVRVTI